MELLKRLNIDVDELAYQLIAYESGGYIDIERFIIDEVIKDDLYNESEAIFSLWNEYCYYNESYDAELFYNDDDFFSTYFSNDPIKAVQATQFGDYHYNDEYVKFDGYGNLDSVDSYSMNDYLNNDEFMNWILLESGEYDHLLDDDFRYEVIEKTLELVEAGY